jgi:hypothetical protein
MGLTAKDTGGGSNFPPCPAGLHHAVCYGVFDTMICTTRINISV